MTKKHISYIQCGEVVDTLNPFTLEAVSEDVCELEAILICTPCSRQVRSGKLDCKTK